MKKYENGKYINITLEDMKDLPRFIEEDTTEDRLEKLEKLFSNILPLLERLGGKFE